MPSGTPLPGGEESPVTAKICRVPNLAGAKRNTINLTIPEVQRDAVQRAMRQIIARRPYAQISYIQRPESRYQSGEFEEIDRPTKYHIDTLQRYKARSVVRRHHGAG